MSSKEEEAPFHVLMASSRPTQELLVRNDEIQRDFLARRYKYLNEEGKKESSIWSAVFPIERAMVECCELPVDEEDRLPADVSLVIGGCLYKGKERDFVRLLALHCHTAATRALALAILQRTVEQDELEREVAMEAATTNDVGEEGNDKTSEAKAAMESKQESTQHIASDIGRMGRFLQAGGLKILKQWLLDAMTQCKIVVTKPATTSPPQQQQTPTGNNKTKDAPTRVIQTVASPSGPLLLPLLSLLKDMPFDKGLVISTKINKPIRKLRKNLDEAIASRRTQRADDKQWTDPLAGGLVVDQVQTEVASLMKTWEAKVKTSELATKDPLQALQEQIKERSELLKAYDAGEAEKPKFLQEFEEQERLEKEAEALSKMTTEQRAARERQNEREKMLELTRQKQSEARARLEMLQKKTQEESRKRAAEGKLGGAKKRTDRRVKWKDGLQNSDNFRKRNLLEQVHVYTKDTDYASEDEMDTGEQEEEDVM